MGCEDRAVARRPYPLALLTALGSVAVIAATEGVLSGGFPQGVPWAVLVFLAVTWFGCVVGCVTAVSLRGRRPLLAVAAVAGGVLCALGWVTVVADQLPCFLGGRGC